MKTNAERANHGARDTHQDRRIDHQARQVAKRDERQKEKAK